MLPILAVVIRVHASAREMADPAKLYMGWWEFKKKTAKIMGRNKYYGMEKVI